MTSGVEKASVVFWKKIVCVVHSIDDQCSRMACETSLVPASSERNWPGGSAEHLFLRGGSSMVSLLRRSLDESER